MEEWQPNWGFLWVHLDRKHPRVHGWLHFRSGLDALAREALLAEETRPRGLSADDTLLVILRGVNLNPGAAFEDMVSIRCWIEPNRVITLRRQKVLAIQDLGESMPTGKGPRAPGEFLSALPSRLVDRVGPVVSELEDRLDTLEEDLLERGQRDIRARLSGIRRQAIALRRHLMPQREVTSQMSYLDVSWLPDACRARLRETADRVTRYVEDLDATRERAAVTQEEFASRMQDQMNHTMYLLSLVATVFLPLSFLTGLLGINVAGIPWAENKLGFIIVCVMAVAIAVLEVIFFCLRRWLQ